MADIFGLTRKQRDVLLVIQELTLLDGAAPSYDEIGHELGFKSRGHVAELLVSLEARGYIRRIPGATRSIVVVHPIPMPEEPTFVGFFDDHILSAALSREEMTQVMADVGARQ